MSTDEKTVNMVTITIDEYFDLRQKAEMNHYLMDRFGQLDLQIRELDKRLYDAERYINSVR